MNRLTSIPYAVILEILLVVLSLMILLFGTSCAPAQVAASGLESTRAALDAQSAQIAQASARDTNATQVALSVQATVLAQQAAELTAVANQAQTDPTSLPTAEPTPTPQPTDPPPPPPTDEPLPTEIPPTPAPDFEEWMESAEILLFEDVAGDYMERYIRQALDSMGLPYVDVKDAVGTFKAQLLSGTDWDLIITGVEARSGVKGEFFDYLNDSINNGSSVILELWNLDDIAGGKISSLLTRCGIKFQSDWWDPPSESRSIWWLVPDHPIFHEPNEGMSLAHYSIYWTGDAGDFIKTTSGGDATLLAGNLAWEKSSHGTLATCIDGQLIIQTHSTHDYHKEDIIPLWQNYIYNALKTRFESAQ
jgi:hypothetical protein